MIAILGRDYETTKIVTFAGVSGERPVSGRFGMLRKWLELVAASR